MTLDSDRFDGEFAFAEGLGWSYPGELISASLTNGGAVYEMGSSEAGAKNALACAGQSIPIAPESGDRLYVLAAATSDATGLFSLAGAKQKVEVQQFTGLVGQWDSRVVDGEVVTDPALFLPGFVKPDSIAWYETHRHARAGNDPYIFTYMFQYVLSIPDGATEVVLPDNDKIRLFAMALVNDPNDRTVAASRLFDGFDPLHAPIDWILPQVAPDPVESLPEGVDAATVEASVETGGDKVGCGGSCRHSGRTYVPTWFLLLVAFVAVVAAVFGKSSPGPQVEVGAGIVDKAQVEPACEAREIILQLQPLCAGGHGPCAHEVAGACARLEEQAVAQPDVVVGHGKAHESAVVALGGRLSPSLLDCSLVGLVEVVQAEAHAQVGDHKVFGGDPAEETQTLMGRGYCVVALTGKVQLPEQQGVVEAQVHESLAQRFVPAGAGVHSPPGLGWSGDSCTKDKQGKRQNHIFHYKVLLVTNRGDGGSGSNPVQQDFVTPDGARMASE